MIIPRAPARGVKGSRVGGGSNDPWRVISDRFGPRPHDGGGSFEGETTDPYGLSGAGTMSR